MDILFNVLFKENKIGELRAKEDILETKSLKGPYEIIQKQQWENGQRICAEAISYRLADIGKPRMQSPLRYGRAKRTRGRTGHATLCQLRLDSW